MSIRSPRPLFSDGLDRQNPVDTTVYVESLAHGGGGPGQVNFEASRPSLEAFQSLVQRAKRTCTVGTDRWMHRVQPSSTTARCTSLEREVQWLCGARGLDRQSRRETSCPSVQKKTSSSTSRPEITSPLLPCAAATGAPEGRDLARLPGERMVSLPLGNVDGELGRLALRAPRRPTSGGARNPRLLGRPLAGKEFRSLASSF